MLSRIRWFLIITAVLLLVVFSFANTEPVSVKMPLIFSREIPLAMLLVSAAILGFMVGSLWTAWMLRRHRPAPPIKETPAKEAAKPEKAAANPGETSSGTGL